MEFKTVDTHSYSMDSAKTRRKSKNIIRRSKEAPKEVSKEEIEWQLRYFSMRNDADLIKYRDRRDTLKERQRQKKAEQLEESMENNMKEAYPDERPDPEKTAFEVYKDSLPPRALDASEEESVSEQWAQFPPDEDEWSEEDLGEVWMNAPRRPSSMAYDPTLGITGMEKRALDRIYRMQKNRFGIIEDHVFSPVDAL